MQTIMHKMDIFGNSRQVTVNAISTSE